VEASAETEKKGSMMRRFKTLLMMAVVASICGVMLTGCVSHRRGGRVDNRTDNRDDRKDTRR
jgi:hypothetical protein